MIKTACTEANRCWRIESDAAQDWWFRWDQLNGLGCGEHPLLRSDFARSLEKHFGDGRTIRAVCSDDLGDVAMALFIRSSAITWQLFQPSQAPMPLMVLRNGIVSDPLFSLRAAFSLSPGLLPLRFEIGRLDRPFFPSFDLSDARFCDVDVKGTTIAIDTSGSFNAYWSDRPKKLRQNVDRYFRRIEADGLAYRLERIAAPDSMASCVEQFGNVESAGWKGQMGTAVHADNQQGRFYADVLTEYARTGHAIGYQFWIGEQLAAARLVVSGGGMVVPLKTTYEESCSRYAPGRLLTYLMIKDLFERPEVQTIEFYTNADRDTLDWATSDRAMYVANLYSGVFVRSASEMISSSKAAVKRLLIKFSSKALAKQDG